MKNICIVLVILLFPANIFSSDLKPVAERKSLPAFEIKTLDGRRIRSSDFRGVSIVSLWATWCPSCKQELNALEIVINNIGRDKITVYAIATDGPETVANVRGEVKKWTHIIAVDSSGVVNAKLNPRGSIPFMLLIDAKGRIAYSGVGFQNGDEAKYENLLMGLIGE